LGLKEQGVQTVRGAHPTTIRTLGIFSRQGAKNAKFGPALSLRLLRLRTKPFCFFLDFETSQELPLIPQGQPIAIETGLG
jgi:hypothetical protein